MGGLPTDEILRIAETHGAFDLKVFGSYARGDASDVSDLDLLVSLKPGGTLFDLIALEQELEELLRIPVEVVTERELHPRLRDRILAEAQPLAA
jgi:uncharacterized protein